MALRKQDVVRLAIRRDEASRLPAPLLKLYNNAALFLDKQSADYDHYWAVGIHKAIHKAFPEFAEAAFRNKLVGGCGIARGKRGRKRNDKQMALKLVDESPPASQGDQNDRAGFVRFYEIEKNGFPTVGQHVVLISSIWSTRNRMTIESGTRGKVVKIGSKIKVHWKLPYYRKPLSDRFGPDEYQDYFEEE